MRFISELFWHSFYLETNRRSKLQVLQVAMPCQAPCEEGVMEVMTCECVTHWTWSNSWQVASALLTILWPHTYTIIATSFRGLNSHWYWPKFCCPKVSDRRGWFELFHLYTKNSDTWKLSSQARGQWSLAISLPKTDLIQARMDFGLVKQLALAGQIRPVTERGGKGSRLAVAL